MNGKADLLKSEKIASPIRAVVVLAVAEASAAVAALAAASVAAGDSVVAAAVSAVGSGGVADMALELELVLVPVPALLPDSMLATSHLPPRIPSQTMPPLELNHPRLSMSAM